MLWMLADGSERNIPREDITGWESVGDFKNQVDLTTTAGKVRVLMRVEAMAEKLDPPPETDE